MPGQLINITIIGAGVSGLTTALLLSQNPRFRVTIVAKYMPGDSPAEYASPWAGANFWPMGAEGSEQAKLEKATWPEMYNLAKNHPDSGIAFQKSRLHTRHEDVGKAGTLFATEDGSPPWWSTLFDDFKSLDKSQMPLDIHTAFEFTSVCINTTIYLHWLLSKCLRNGVVVKRGVVDHVTDAASLHTVGQSHLVVNCTGLMARNLGGVEDKSVVPARGQIMLVRNHPDIMTTASSLVAAQPGDMAYMMCRPGGGGTILGGCYQVDNWNDSPDHKLAERIMKRCVELYPELAKSVDDLSVIRQGVGFRPLRPQGVRLETEHIRGIPVVHNYGHGGWGYQSSYGCAKTVVSLVEQEVGLTAKL